MPLTKVTSNGITDSAVNSDKIANCGVAAADLGANAVTSAKINDGTITAADLNVVLTDISTFNNYTNADCTLDNTVTIGDYNLYEANSGMIGASQVRF